MHDDDACGLTMDTIAITTSILAVAAAVAIGAIVAAINLDTPRVSHVEATGIEFVTTMAACNAVECRKE